MGELHNQPFHLVPKRGSTSRSAPNSLISLIILNSIFPVRPLGQQHSGLSARN